MLPSDTRRWLEQLQQNRHRDWCVLEGDLEWRYQQLNLIEPRHGLWLGHTSPQSRWTVQPSLRQMLGQEIDCAIVCVEQGIDAEALGIIAGCLKASGLLWVLIPPLAQAQQLKNPANQRFLSYPLSYQQSRPDFEQHFYRQLKQSAHWLTQGEDFYRFTPQDLRPNDKAPTQNVASLNPDQQAALDKLNHLAFGKRHRPLIISAERGRGKSTLLGEAAAQLLLQGKRHIMISAPHFQQCAQGFKRAYQTLSAQLAPDELTQDNTALHLGQQSLQFYPPDELLRQANNIRDAVVLIDEAAQWPVPMLKQVALSFSRVAFSTTLNGYEGSGQGFRLRFQPFLDRHYPQWQAIELSQPVRWGAHDPLERAINELLTLDSQHSNTQASHQDQQAPRSTQHSIQSSSFQQLNDSQRAALFQLLRLAHYQTRAADIQHWMAAPQLQLYLCMQNQHPIAALLSQPEGGLEPLPVGKRVKGHLVPQLLAQHTDERALLKQTSTRVMRLAVHPQWQGQGLGTQLVQHWLQHSQADWHSASFGASESLYRFWRKQGFNSFHVGAKRDKASGTHNLVMVHAPHQAQWQKLQHHFAQQFPHSLMESLNELDTELSMQLLAEYPAKVDADIEHKVLSYALGQRPYEAVSQALWQWSLIHAPELMSCTAAEQQLWLNKVVRKQPWHRQASPSHPGRKQIEKHLQDIILQVFKDQRFIDPV